MRVAQRLRNFILLFAIIGFIFSFQPTAAGNKLSDDYDNLFLWVTVLSALVAILVVALWIYFMKTFSENNEVERVPLSHETSRKLEITWTLVAIVIVVLLMVVSYPVLFDLDNTEDLEPDATIYVKAFEYGWLFTYENTTGDLVTEDNVVIKADANYEFVVTSITNFIHSFFVPDLHFKMDAIPGVNNSIVVKITETGTYDILCAEYCGVSHSEMRPGGTGVRAGAYVITVIP
ncbi:MAG: cytochrome c oxidase subunit II [Candidatus Kariarchaeaceae archaeon]|jgi:cytochrome c oxidase subunit 2